MKKALLATALVAAVAAPAFGQSSAPSDQVSASVAQTIYNNLARRGLLDQWPTVSQKMPAAVTGVTGGTGSSTWLSFIFTVGQRYNWFPLKVGYGYPRQVAPDECYGIYCEAAGHFDNGMVGFQECDELEFDVDENGTPMFPSLPLSPSGPIIYDGPAFYTTKDLSSDRRTANNGQAAALWWYHRQNIGKPKEQWIGAAWVSDPNGPDLHSTRPAYRDPVTANVIPYYDTLVNVFYNGFQWRNGGSSEPCPPETTAGGDFDFYAHSSNAGQGVSTDDQQDECTFYAKNFALSASGYGYPETVPVQWATANFTKVFNSNFMLNECRVSPELIRMIADVQLRYILQTYLPSITYEPILIEDVGTGGIHPIGRALLTENPIDLNETSVGSDQRGAGGAIDTGPVPNGYNPPEGTTGVSQPTGSDGGVNIDLSHPDNPTPEFEAPVVGSPDWLPDLPSFAFPTAQNGCPVFGFDALERSFVIDQHCQHVEDNRATIASVMLVVFSVMSFMVILRA